MSKQPYKRIAVIDFETRWDKKDYTLSKMTTEQYVRDPRFKAFGFCIKFFDDGEQAEWVTHDKIPSALKSYNWSNTAVLAHNAQFDVAILSWVYGVQPCFVFDSLSMARALRGIEVGNSLAQLAEEFKLPPKGKAVHSTEGLIDLPPEIETELAAYCQHDTFLCEEIFKRLVQGYPAKELRLIDMTLKMFINPVLELDKEMLNAAITEEERRRTTLLTKLGVEETALSSNQQFADVLLSMGVAPPTKISKTTGCETLALAKNDALFQALLNSGNEDVELLCEARLAVKSTLERTRAQRFLDISSRGRLPVPLNYYGAHTGRWSASKGSGLNLQNLKRGSFLRKAIMAPEGYILVVCDLSQIEPRVLAWLAGYDAMLDIFRAGGDPYAAFGAQMFGIPGLSKDSHPDLRQSAKSALLGCGYGLGWAAFAGQLLTGFLGAPPTRYDKAFAKQLGVNAEYVQKFTDWDVNMEKLAEIPHNCTDEELLVHALATKKIIDKYRDAADPVVQFWDICQNLIHRSLVKGEEVPYKCVTFRHEEVVLPSGLALRYTDLKGEPDDKGRVQWVYGPSNKQKKLYGGKLTENIVQAVARCVMTDGMLRIQTRYPCVLTVHDEVVCLVPEAEAEDAKTWVLAQMVMEPKYMPGIPLDADADVAHRYGDAK
jgi:DNA polymerase I-like protein with 3'-5' exonuclease and polymerase domains